MDFFQPEVRKSIGSRIGSGVVSALMAVGLLGAGGAFAEMKPDPMAGIHAALEAREGLISQMTDGDVRESTQRALNAAVREGVRSLRKNGDRGLATRYEREWENRFANHFTAFGLDELGDHKPLSLWLANFYVKLEERLGRNVVRTGVLGDIYLMNYAIPVVFAPNGAWRTTESVKRDSIEYRKHFIPFANVVTYWGAYIACTQAIKGDVPGKDGKKICEEASQKLRFVMGRYIAPKISDFVFNKANRIETRLEITERDLVYLSAADLERELSQEGGAL